MIRCTEMRDATRTLWLGGGFGLLAFAVGYPTSRSQANITPDQAAFFEAKVRPILVDKCLSCHGKQDPAANLRVDSLAALLIGGASGAAIVPGDPEKSLLIRAIRQTGKLKMPQGGKLDAESIANLESWVKMGAPWPEVVAKPAAKLWSLEPVGNAPPPKVKAAAWVRNPIDAFVLAKLEASHLHPAPPADRRTLIRRVTFDLIGLPPTPSEVDAFVADKSPNAYGKVVDRLLASPHYGERWARRWMDVARYADTKGYVFNEDRNYPNAYTYRAWLIDTFNRDLPYDQFIIAQLAADRVTEGDDLRQLAALGFLTLGRRFLNSEPDIIDDRIDVTMRGFQGLTVACARCHDHKFDPIPTQDYYSLYGVFASSEERTEPISEPAIRDPWRRYNAQVAKVEADHRALVKAQVARLRRINKDPATANSLSAAVRMALQGLREEAPAEGDKLKKLAPAFEANAQAKLKDLDDEISQLKKSAPKTPEFAMAMADRSNPHDGVVFKRGNPGAPGPTAPRRFLLALSRSDSERERWTKGSGRLELAKSIASRENPLTARVFVNRIWQEHFGAAIVRTPSDFGRQGEKPTHPQLLDYLARTFMDGGWSIKRLHRLIVTSSTYCQSSNVSPATYAADPENRLVGRMNRRRLDLEQTRDALLFASGQLDLATLGGPSVDLWARPFAPRRALYGFIERQNLPGIFRTFDFASPDSTSARRFLTTVPQQALFFLNSSFSMDQAKAVTGRAEIKSSADDAQRIRRLYRVLFDRLPDADELATGLAYLRDSTVEAPKSPWSYGYGAVEGNRVVGFTPLTTFKDSGYRVGDVFPDPTLGYLLLNAQGGHPGHDRAHAVIRRWTAPSNGSIRVSGTLRHTQKEGDGVHAIVVSSRLGPVGEWVAHNQRRKTEIASITVQTGDTIDFVVDPIQSDAFDGFTWSPTVSLIGGGQTWSAESDFAPPGDQAPSKLTLYAQALIMTNEFLFID